MITNRPIQDKSFDFSVETVHFCKYLQRKKEFVVSKQLLRAGTSIGANVEEAQFAESKKDFTHKMHIALKEAYETRYWLRLIIRCGTSNKDKVQEIFNNVSEIIALLTAIVKTSRK